MATHKSAEKRHRQNLKRNARNNSARSEMRTLIKGAVKKAEAKDFDAAQELVKAASKKLDKAAIHGLVHKKNAQRRISRLAKRVNKLTNAK